MFTSCLHKDKHLLFELTQAPFCTVIQVVGVVRSKGNSPDLKLLTARSVEYFEKPTHDFFKVTLLLFWHFEHYKQCHLFPLYLRRGRHRYGR